MKIPFTGKKPAKTSTSISKKGKNTAAQNAPAQNAVPPNTSQPEASAPKQAVPPVKTPVKKPGKSPGKTPMVVKIRRVVSWLVLIAFSFMCILFAVANRQPIELSYFYPVPFVLQTYAFIGVLVPLAIGLTIGVFYMRWLDRIKFRHFRNETRENAALKQQIEQMKKQLDIADQRLIAEGLQPLEMVKKAA